MDKNSDNKDSDNKDSDNKDSDNKDKNKQDGSSGWVKKDGIYRGVDISKRAATILFVVGAAVFIAVIVVALITH